MSAFHHFLSVIESHFLMIRGFAYGILTRLLRFTEWGDEKKKDAVSPLRWQTKLHREGKYSVLEIRGAL